MESNLVDDKIEDFYFGQLTRYANAPFFTVNLDRVNELAVKTPPGHIQKQINRLLRTLGGHVEFSGLSSLKPTIEPILNAVSQDEIGRIVLKVRSEQELSNPPCYYDVDVFFVDGIVSFRAYWHVSQRHDMKGIRILRLISDFSGMLHPYLKNDFVIDSSFFSCHNKIIFCNWSTFTRTERWECLTM
jgi:hypothetical protein